MDCPDYYALLGVPRFYATQEEIRAAYLAQIKFFHPDAGNVPPMIATDKTQLLNHIYAILRDPDRKRRYDEQLANSIQKEEILRQQAAHAEVFEERRRREQARIERRNKIIWFCIGAAAILFISIIAISATKNNSQSPAASSPSQPSASQPVSSPKPSAPVQSSKPSPSPSLTPVSRPANGTILTGSGLTRVAPLTINTVGGDDYYVKLVSASTGKTVMAFFVRGGLTVDIDVPLGTYKLRYATGDTWYGTKELFGPDTLYYEADDLFPFEDMGSYYSGWTVSLYLVPNGNLDTDRIDASEF